MAEELIQLAAHANPDNDDQQCSLEIAIHLLRQASVSKFKQAVAAYNKDHGLYQRKPKVGAAA